MTTHLNDAPIDKVLIAVQDNGKIAVEWEGRSPQRYTPYDTTTIVLAHYNSNGTLDATFGANGLVVSQKFVFNVGNGADEHIANIAIQSDGKIVTIHNINLNRSVYIRVSRYNTDGTPDASFTSYSSDYSAATSLLIQNNGKILIGIRYYSNHIIAGISIPRLIRLNSDGSPDASFGSNGIADSNTDVISLAVQNDGKIAAAGGNRLSRLNSNGTIDSSFGTNGIVTSGITFNSILVQPDGKILVGGSQGGNFAVARYQPQWHS